MKKYYPLGVALCALSCHFLSGADNNRANIVMKLEGGIATFTSSQPDGTWVRVKRLNEPYKDGDFIYAGERFDGTNTISLTSGEAKNAYQELLKSYNQQRQADKTNKT